MKKKKKFKIECKDEIRFSITIFAIFFIFIVFYTFYHSFNDIILLLPLLIILLSLLIQSRCYKKCIKLSLNETIIGVMLLIIYIFLFFILSDFIINKCITFEHKHSVSLFGYNIKDYTFLNFINNLLLSLGVLLSSIYTSIIIPLIRNKKEKEID